MTVGEALKDKRTSLGRAALQVTAEHELRLAAAREMVAAEGITLEEALRRIWSAK